ncbi:MULTISPECIES: DEAD/DEAH box helicase [unclassified Granulicatella]|uniref:DEAD/DEAH box helicase n=1 Tax=unclassified Granulicatella TaxID=2630493 RepID=UPI0010747C6E|nr:MULTISPECIES: DEAD/DEAH box helicase [unclassified Granulicatella]MBF0780947.1 DEAD/DEAH box helicase [Granulicatella sp. 19428wC4_WM01]TFU92989.1 DEAD/DEAH box helicase [Granulicatella sp. WM01]
MNKFLTYGFPEFINQALEELGFKQPTTIQEKIIPLIQSGKNVIGQSQTGSGKSHSFLLPLISKIDSQLSQVQVVITSPSRELANQLYKITQQLVKYSSISVSQFVGGTDKQRQINKLHSCQPHIVIGTPGRILDLMKEHALHIQHAQYLVIDEADMTLDLGFLNDVDEIASRMPKYLQMMVFSATIPQKLKPFLKKYMENPEEVILLPETVVADTITNQLLSTKGQDEIDILYHVLTMGEPYLAMIFVNTKQKAEKVTYALRERGLKVASIHGDVPARERKRLMRQIQQLEYQYVVATDLAARGIDINGVSHVINLDIPADLDFFIHRVGRTGRNGLHGHAITFYTPSDDTAINALEKRGISFKAVALKNGELVETFDRKRREKREDTKTFEPDARIKGMVKKAKKTVKPGYKRKLKTEIEKRERQKRRQAKK